MSIPKHFIETSLILNFQDKDIVVWERDILHLLVRDYHFMYSKKKIFDDSEWTELRFYCRKEDEGRLIYAIGCYAQTAFTFFNKKIFGADHRVPDNFPACICVSDEKGKKRTPVTVYLTPQIEHVRGQRKPVGKDLQPRNPNN